VATVANMTSDANSVDINQLDRHVLPHIGLSPAYRPFSFRSDGTPSNLRRFRPRRTS
jgi:hypothetical protein